MPLWATRTSPKERVLTPGSVLLRRRGVVYVPAADPAVPDALAQAGVTLLEADLLTRGYLMAPALRDAFTALAPGVLRDAGLALLQDLDVLLGADRPHVPLFRGFPDTTPANTEAFYVDRLLVHLFQHPHQPCVLCGTVGTVQAVSPCAHLICRECFDARDLSACPVCHRRIDVDDPFLQPLAARRFRRPDPLPERLRTLHRGDDAAADAFAEVLALLARPTAPPPLDREELPLLLRRLDSLHDLPVRIPSRETKALVLAEVLRDVTPDALEFAATRIDSATDVARLLAVRAGGDGGLAEVPRLGSVPRALRRALLALLDGLPTDRLLDDMLRHRRLWKSAGERLHPYEQAARHPRAALAFAVVRSTAVREDALGSLLREQAATLPGVTEAGGTFAYVSWRARVEHALAGGDVPTAVALLAERPGELLRRADHLLRLTVDAQPVLDALTTAARRAAPAVLLSALGHLRTRDGRRRWRVFLPAGGTARTYVDLDARPPLSAATQAVDVLTAEALRRAAQLEPVKAAVIDTALHDVMAPFAERTAARALVTVPRGSRIPLPASGFLRLFLHWTEPAEGPQTDLDLSMAMFDASWTQVATCDYTHLRVVETAAVHSGDLTSAPPPLGASEFVDLDVPALRATGARHLVMSVFSYNNVPFEQLPIAFAGLMIRSGDPGGGEVFDPADVEQRYDLTGTSRASVPLVVDLDDGSLRWLDTVAGVSGTHHAVHRHADKLAVLGDALGELYESGARVSLGELAIWHAAARSRVVLLRDGEGGMTRFVRRTDEPVEAYADRLRAGTDADGPAAPGHAATASLQFLLRGDLSAPTGATVYALRPATLDPSAVRLLAASDVAGALAVG